VSSRRGEYRPGGGPAADPERAQLEAGRRARGRLRRYGAANRLNRLGTLTYEGAGCHDPGQARAHVGTFFRALRTDLGGAAFPYVWVPEWHKTRAPDMVFMAPSLSAGWPACLSLVGFVFGPLVRYN
jgi:hypothetical protein